MATAMERFHDYWSGGYPDVTRRFLLKTVHPMSIIITSYVLFVKVVGPYIMRNRKPVQMRPLIVVYNFSLVAFYVWYILRGVLFLPKMGFSLFCGSMLQSDEVDVVRDVFFHAYILYIVKFVELLDTVFLVLSKKFNMIRPLHVFHHAIVPVFSWFVFKSETSGYIGIYAGVNCIVHVVMYTYYAVAALGPKYQKYIWWKKYLTSLQIFQFFLITIYTNVMYVFGCVESPFIFVLCNILTIVFFFWFIEYYRGAYNTTEKKEEPHKNGFHKSNGVKQENGIHKSNGNPKTGGLPMAYKKAAKKKE